MSDPIINAPVTVTGVTNITAPVLIAGTTSIQAPVTVSGSISINAPVTTDAAPIIQAPVTNNSQVTINAPITIQGGIGPSGEKGEKGDTGPTGFVDNFIINSGISDDPEATRNALELGSAALAETGDFYPSSNPSGFITGIDLDGYVQDSVTGSFITDSDTGAFYPRSNPSGFITGVDLSDYATKDFVTDSSGDLQSQIGELQSKTGSYVTGSVVRPSETGQFYPASNPSGFGGTGDFYPASNPSGFLSPAQSWFGLVSSWTVEPTLNTILPSGEVYNYTYGATTYYRFVPDPYTSSGDIFYASFSSPNLSNPIVSRGISI